MSVLNRMTGHFDFNRPAVDGFGFSELEEVLEKVERFGSDYQQAVKRVRELTDSRPVAERADVEAHAKALQSGRKDPGTPNADKLEAELRDTARRRDALRVALQSLQGELYATIEEPRAGWVPQVEAGLSEAEKRAEAAREAARKAAAEAVRCRELQAWLEDPQGYRPGRATKDRSGAHQTPKAKPPTFSIAGGRPSSRSSGSRSSGAA